MKKLFNKSLLVLPSILLMVAGSVSVASSVPQSAQEKSAESKAVQSQTQQASSDKVKDQRSKITEEAVAAIESDQNTWWVLPAS